MNEIGDRVDVLEAVTLADLFARKIVTTSHSQVTLPADDPELTVDVVPGPGYR